MSVYFDSDNSAETLCNNFMVGFHPKFNNNNDQKAVYIKDKCMFYRILDEIIGAMYLNDSFFDSFF